MDAGHLPGALIQQVCTGPGNSYFRHVLADVEAPGFETTLWEPGLT